MFSLIRARPARAAAILALLIILCLAAAILLLRRNEPIQSGFYVLALSWSPSFCEAERERAPDRVPQDQCGARPYQFVVHGLWPQDERGPLRDYCQVPAPRLSRDIVSSMLDLMPSPRLVFNEWDRHGTCSGFGQQDSGR